MIKRLISLVLIVGSMVLTGCATQQGQNALIGGAVGGVAGNLFGGNTQSTLIGAGIGALIGANVSQNQGQPVFMGGNMGTNNGLSPQACPSGYRQINGAWQCMGGVGVAQQQQNRQPNCRRNRDGAAIFASSEEECRNFSR